MNKIVDEYQFGGVLKTIDGMNILADEVSDEELKSNIAKYIHIKDRKYDNNRGDKLFILDKFDLEGLKNYLLTVIPKYDKMKDDKSFAKRLYASIQLLKINKIIHA